MRSNVLELFGANTEMNADWDQIVLAQQCPFLGRKCLKIRKSQPHISIGTCSVRYNVRSEPGVIICPYRLLERKQIFMDCLHLLTLHEPGNELHVVPEVQIPGGNVDYFLVSANARKVVDFVGIELQALDTTGSVWPQRQAFLQSVGVHVEDEGRKSYGINWKMTAKTTLVQLHHKIQTFEQLRKHLVLVAQQPLLGYMAQEFSFAHVYKQARLGDSMHFHAYALVETPQQIKISLAHRLSTDSQGIAVSLGLRADANIELQAIMSTLDSKISDATLLTI